DLAGASPGPAHHLDGAPGGVLPGVLEQVDEDPLQVVAVGDDLHPRRVDVDGDLGGHGDDVEDVVDHRLDRQRLGVDGDRPTVQPGDHEQVLDEPLEAARLAAGGGDELPGGVRLRC